MIKGIKFASVPVTDQDRALEFYTKKLGLRIITDAPFNDDQRWIELGFPRAETKLVLFTPEEHRTLIGGFLNITFVSDAWKRRRRSCRSSATRSAACSSRGRSRTPRRSPAARRR